MRLVSDFALAVVTIWQEARGEPYAGKIAVGEVIRNRMRKADKTVAEIVLRPYQFSGMNTTDSNRTPSFLIDDSDQVVKDCAQAWLDSTDSGLTEGATLYLNPTILASLPAWTARAVPTVKIGAHQFYREPDTTFGQKTA